MFTGSANSNLNVLEQQLWVNSLATKNNGSNKNFTVISSYKGHITTKHIKVSLDNLTKFHPYLKTTIKVIEGTPHFFQLVDFDIPLVKYSLEGKEQWRKVAKKDLREHFTDELKPLWRVSFLKGKQEGQILLTFHHSIADGICAIELMNRIYQGISSILLGQEFSFEFSSNFPPLSDLFRLLNKKTENNPELAEGISPARPELMPGCLEESSPSEKMPGEGSSQKTDTFDQVPPANALDIQNKNPRYQTDFVLHILDEYTTNGIIRWGKQNGIRVHSILFAAFLKATTKIKNLEYHKLEALSVVNYRQFFDPPVSKELLRSLYTCVGGAFNVANETDLAELAKAIQADLHMRLQEGEHIRDLKNLSIRAAANLHNPMALLEVDKCPPNMLCITNAGAITFEGTYQYKQLSMTDLFLVAGCDQYYEHEDNATLGVVTFQNRIYLTLFFLEEIFAEQDGKAILLEMEKYLSDLPVNNKSRGQGSDAGCQKV